MTLILFALGTISSLASRQLRSLPVAALALATLLTALQIKITPPPATAGWHYVSVYPFVTIVAAYGVFAGAKLLLRGDSSAHVAVACAVAAALAYDASGMVKYLHNLATSEPTNVGWSPAVYQLSRDLQRNNHPVFVADWGIVNPLFALHPSRRYTELAFQLETATPASLQQLGALLGSTPGPKLIVTHPPSRLVFPRVDTNLFAAIGRHLRLIATVDGHNGKPTYTIYTYR